LVIFALKIVKTGKKFDEVLTKRKQFFSSFLGTRCICNGAFLWHRISDVVIMTLNIHFQITICDFSASTGLLVSN